MKTKLRKLLIENCGYAFPPKYLDEVIGRALRKRMKVTIFECKDKEGGLGIKVDGDTVYRNLAWECFETSIRGEDYK